jgi:hypothetical protein
MAANSKKINVLVIDTDREDTQGWGMPDIVTRITGGVETAKDFYLGYQAKLREWVFQRAIEEAQRHELYTPEHSQDLQIVYRGQVDVDVWEECPEDGCQVPYDYADYNWYAGVIFTEDTEDEELKQIEWFTAKYSSGQREVVEYYHPLAEFSLANVRDASGVGHTWTVWRVGKPKLIGGLEIFAEELPAMIEYSDPSDDYLIWQMVDDDGDGKFDRRREIVRR